MKSAPAFPLFLLAVATGADPPPTAPVDNLWDPALAVIQPMRRPVGRNEDWQYALNVAQRGFDEWKLEQAATGPVKQHLFQVRTDLFFEAAETAGDWIPRYLNTPPKQMPPFESAYVFASFVHALFLEYSGEYWKANNAFRGVLAECSVMTAGAQIPKYNGAPIDQLAFGEWQRLKLLIAQLGPTEPYDRETHFAMAFGNDAERHREAVNFDQLNEATLTDFARPSKPQVLDQTDSQLPSS